MNCSGVGRIVRGVGGLYAVVSESPENREYLCSARGLFRKEGLAPLVGDFVDFLVDPSRGGYASIIRIHKRGTQLIRPAVANVHQLLIVLTLSVPAPDFLLVDKLILHALSNGITPALCFNKSDLPAEADFAAEPAGYARAGFTLIFASNTREKISRENAGKADSSDPDEDEGLDELKNLLSNKVTILAGQSGVGKSTLFNGILESNKMPVGGMSHRISRGKHTTRHAELTRVKGGGWLVDSPGFSMFEYTTDNFRSLDTLYPEFAPFREHCRFKECSHIHEPGCAVRDALAKGELHAGRHSRYAALYESYKRLDSRKYK